VTGLHAPAGPRNPALAAMFVVRDAQEVGAPEALALAQQLLDEHALGAEYVRRSHLTPPTCGGSRRKWERGPLARGNPGARACERDFAARPARWPWFPERTMWTASGTVSYTLAGPSCWDGSRLTVNVSNAAATPTATIEGTPT